jgi:rhodanese-related sulfurtransferase
VPKAIGRDDVQRLAGADAQIVDVLPREEYAHAHLPGAINLPLKDLTPAVARAHLQADSPTIVDCYDPT